LTLGTVPNFTYQVQYKDRLDAGSWTPLGAFQRAVGATLEWPDTLGTNTQRFYRAVRAP